MIKYCLVFIIIYKYYFGIIIDNNESHKQRVINYNNISADIMFHIFMCDSLHVQKNPTIEISFR